MSHSNSSKVGEIFTAAGAAFTKLGELTMTLHSVGEPLPSSGKWTILEMEMLQRAMKSFDASLKKISDSLKTKALTQAKPIIKKKPFEEANVTIKKQMPTQIKTISQDKLAAARTLTNVITQGTPKSADITLNMLNAMEPEVDVEGLTAANKLDYDSPDAS